MRVGIIDYGVGNLASASRAVEAVGHRSEIVCYPDQARDLDRLVLPGVGAFPAGMARLAEHGWPAALHDMVAVNGKPLLGICLGMQLLCDFSPEAGGAKGLGFIGGEMARLDSLGCQHRIPHVGWNSLSFDQQDHPLLAGIPEQTDVYFVHSYACVPSNPVHRIASASYGITFAAVIADGPVWGVQFHPEKSSKAGLRMLQNFIEHRHA